MEGSQSRIRDFLVARLEFLMRRGRDPSDDGVANHVDLEMGTAGEMENHVPMATGQEGSPTPPAPATSTSGQDLQMQRGMREIIWGTAKRALGRILTGIKAAVSTVKLHVISIIELNGVQSEDHEQCCLVLVLLGFLSGVLSALLLQLELFNLLIKYLIYASSVTQMLVPFFLFVSSGQLQPWMIFTVPLPFFSVTLFHQTSLGAGAAIDVSALDHNFEVSAWIYALSDSALISPSIISFKLVATSPSACSLFLTIFIARYVVLITTLRPPGVISQVETLLKVAKILWGLTVVLIILDHFGWRAALVATSVIIVDAVLFSMPGSPRATNGADHQPSDQQKNQQLLWAVIVYIFFMALTKTYSDHVAAHDEGPLPLGSAATWRLLLYFSAFLWSSQSNAHHTGSPRSSAKWTT